jgi:hypothetical protein
MKWMKLQLNTLPIIALETDRVIEVFKSIFLNTLRFTLEN